MITLGFVIYDVTRPERRRHHIKRDLGKAFFIIPETFYHTCDYAKQNELEHRIKQIVLRPNREVVLDMIVIPSIEFDADVYSFGCDGDINKPPHLLGREKRFKDKPFATEYYNRFIKSGHTQCVKPGPSSSDFIDKHHYYHHFAGNRRWSVGSVRAIGLRIKTGGPGVYEMNLFFSGDVVIGKISGFYIIVTDSLQKRMCCVDPAHKHLDCAVGIDPL